MTYALAVQKSCRYVAFRQVFRIYTQEIALLKRSMKSVICVGELSGECTLFHIEIMSFCTKEWIELMHPSKYQVPNHSKVD